MAKTKKMSWRGWAYLGVAVVAIMILIVHDYTMMPILLCGVVTGIALTLWMLETKGINTDHI